MNRIHMVQAHLGHPARAYKQLMQVPAEYPRNMNRLLNMCYCSSGFVLRNCGYRFDFPRKIGVFYEIGGVLRCVGFFVTCLTELRFEKKRLVVR